MFEVDPKSKKAKLEILEEMKKLMDEKFVHSRLKSKKPVAVEMAVSSVEPEVEILSEDDDLDEDSIEARLAEKADKVIDSEDDEDEDDIKSRLMELYSKLK